MLPEDYEYYPEIKVKDKITIKSKRIFDDLEYRDRIVKDGKDATYHKIGKGFWKDESEDNNYDGDFILLRELDAKEIVKMNDELTEYYKRKK